MKRTNKKLLAALLAAAMTLSLTACGDGGGAASGGGAVSSGGTVQSGGITDGGGQNAAVAEDVSMFTKFREAIHDSKAEYLAQYKPAALVEYDALTDGENADLRDYYCQDPEHSFEYKINKEKGYLVCVGIDKITPEVTIPASVDGIPVLKVNIRTSYPQVTSVTLEEGILAVTEMNLGGTTIVNLPESLIYLRGLSTAAVEMKLPSGLLHLGTLEAPNLAELNLPEGLYELGEGGASGLNISSLTVPASVVHMENAVSDNPNLTEVVFAGEGLKMVDGAFKECPNLKVVNWPDSVEVMYDDVLEGTPVEEMNVPKNLKVFVNGSLGYPAFWGTPYAEKFEGGYIVWHDMLISYTGSNTDIVIPDGVKVILPGAICGAYNDPVSGEIFSATSLTVPGSVELICKWGLETLPSSLEKLVLEEGVTTIQDQAILFYGADKSVCHISVPSTLQNITENTFGDDKNIVFHVAKPIKELEALCNRDTWYEWSCTTDPIE